MSIQPKLSRIHIPHLAALAVFCIGHVNAAIVTFTESSNPAGVFSSSSNVETGTTVATRSAPAVSGSNSFTHWTLNGIRKSDLSGRSVNPASFIILEPTTAVANYLPTSQDSDGDGLPDYYEIECYGSLAQAGTSDSDGDGFNTALEKTRGMSPVAADTLQEGGISRRRGRTLLMIAPSNFTLTETSSPLGIIGNVRTVTDGTTVTLSVAPDPSNSLRFLGWYVGSVRIDSPLIPQPAQITVTGNTTVEARYVDGTTDSDSDLIADWYELFYFGSLSQNGNSDSDSDGFTLAEEVARAQSPLLKDVIQEGGISRRRGMLQTVAPVTSVTYTLTSDPPGLVNETTTVIGGTQVATQNLWGTETSGMRFVGWEIGGARQLDPSGAAAGSATFTASDGLVVTARFVGSTRDDDSDGIPDWFEFAYFGNLSPTAQDDTDGDGFDLSRESSLGLSPLLANTISEGGISRRRSPGLTGVNLQPFERLRHALVEGELTHWFTEDPATSPPSGMDFGASPSPVPCDWDGDGDVDLIVATPGSVSVYENIGSRHAMDFTDRSSGFAGLLGLCQSINQPTLASGDWNLDGYDDLILADEHGSLLLIASTHSFAGSGNGSSTGTFSPVGGTGMIAVGDLNADGRPDLLSAAADGVISCYLHTGNPAAPYADIAPGGMPGLAVDNLCSLTVGDIDMDGFNDVLAADHEGRIWEYHHQTDGSFLLTSKVWGGSGAGFAPSPKIAALDWEGDGDMDLMGGCPDGAIFALRDPKVGRPDGLTAASGATSVLLQWNPDWQSRIKGYHVYRSSSPGSLKSRINQDPVEVPRFLDENLEVAAKEFYHVTALTQANYAGNSAPTLLESPPSATVSADVRRVALSLHDSNALPGTAANVMLSISNSVGVSGQGMDIRIQYPAGLTPNIQFGPRTVRPSGLGSKRLTFTTNETTANGELRIQGTGGTLDAGQGTLFVLTFRVASNLTPGTKLPLTISSATILNAGSPVPLTLSGAEIEIAQPAVVPGHGSVEVGTYALGDLNGDAWANDADIQVLRILLRPSSQGPTDNQLKAGDTNGDGKLSFRDMPGLLRIIAGQEP